MKRSSWGFAKQSTKWSKSLRLIWPSKLQHNPKHWRSSELFKCIASVLTNALIIFFQLVNPLDSSLFVLHASRSIFIKGISSLINHVLCFSICFCVYFFFPNVLFVKLSIPPTLGKWAIDVILLSEGNQNYMDNAKWNETSVRNSL